MDTFWLEIAEKKMLQDTTNEAIRKSFYTEKIHNMMINNAQFLPRPQPEHLIQSEEIYEHVNYTSGSKIF